MMEQDLGRTGTAWRRIGANDAIEREGALDDLALEPLVEELLGAACEEIDEKLLILTRKAQKTATDRGTASTGQWTSPASTLNSAPSIPATAITTGCRRISSSRSIRRHRPATPTSSKRVLAMPWKARVRTASPHTAASELPPLTTATCAAPSQGLPSRKKAVRETGS